MLARHKGLAATCLRAAIDFVIPSRVSGPGSGLRRRGRTAVALLAMVGLLTACSGAAVSPTPTVVPMPTPTPTIAPTPTPPPTVAPPPGYAITPVGLVVKEPEASPGYTLFTPRNTDQAYLINLDGQAVYTWDLPARVRHIRLLANGNLMTAGGNRLLEIDPQGKILWNYFAAGQHHDFLPLPNGNVLLIVRKQKTAAEAIAKGANPDAVNARGLRIDYIIEVRPSGPTTGEIVWEWSVWDHLIQDFDPNQANYGVVADHPERVDLNYRLAESVADEGDWLHTNTVDYNPQLDQIMLSARNVGELWIVDHSTTTEQAAGSTGGNGGRGGDLLYRWGNPAAYRAGSAADQQLYWAHQTQWIKSGFPNAGNIILFNNGNGYSGNQRLYSSIEEIAPPVIGAGYRRPPGASYPPAAPVWSYTAKPPEDWYAQYQSGVQPLPNGNALILDSWVGTIFEVTPAGKIVWKYVNPLTADGPLRQGEPMPFDRRVPEAWDNRIYRTYRYPPDYPGLQKLNLTPGVPLELPAAAP